MLTENYFNGVVTVDGTPQKGDPKPHQLIAASQLDLGEVFAEEKVVRSIDRMKKMLADNGYYQATITYTLEPNPETSQMAIHFHVVPGELARVGEVTIEGDTGIPPRAGSQPHQAEGRRQGEGRARDPRPGAHAQAHYQKNAHLEAQVSLTDRHYHPDTNRLDYIFQVEEGPTVTIATEGEEISKGQLQEAGPGVSGKLG